METFKQDMEETPVVFRRERDGDITAVFPCDVASIQDYTMGCYAHIGQHSGCSFEWYYTTKAAKPEEYVDLKHELESAPYGYRLKVYKRITRGLRDRYLTYRHELMRIDNAA